ncbi:hypothetical protein [Mesorhizobium sp. M1027]|uniref:hypothetical protein n=1 Tax=Mesorhizobium sp. M1027 TaxID=2957050 RepID=UPI00333826C4
MVGFVQLFFITFLLFYQPEGADPVVSQPLQGTEAMARPSRLKWTNETQGFERPKNKTIESSQVFLFNFSSRRFVLLLTHPTIA